MLYRESSKNPWPDDDTLSKKQGKQSNEGIFIFFFFSWTIFDTFWLNFLRQSLSLAQAILELIILFQLGDCIYGSPHPTELILGLGCVKVFNYSCTLHLSKKKSWKTIFLKVLCFIKHRVSSMLYECSSLNRLYPVTYVLSSLDVLNLIQVQHPSYTASC